MNRMKFLAISLATCFVFQAAGSSQAKQIAAPKKKDVVAVQPIAAGNKLEKGLAWLASHQQKNGGWGQGDEAANMGQTTDNIASTPNVADTSVAVLALLRAGHTPTSGKYASNVAKGIGYILSEVEASDKDSLYVTAVRGTRVQAKIGTYVDTFTALMVLTEAKGLMGTPEKNTRLDNARSKVVAKIERNQQADGRFGDQGWAPALTQALAAQGMNRAARAGEKVDRKVLSKLEEQSRQGFDAAKGSFSSEGTAGVGLYGGAAQSASMAEAASTYESEKTALDDKAKNGKTDKDRKEAKQQIAVGKRAVENARDAQKALIDRLDDPSFIAGFGNNGGEEFLSYLFVSETLALRNDYEWREWNGKITKLLHGVQNDDGSWTGHHCITGRTFVTAAAVLVLTAERSPGTKMAAR